MCGICGIYNLTTPQPIGEELLSSMCHALQHRGPDGRGTFAREGIGLGIQRLAIIDLPGGSQPIANEDESIWIVCNGEIYNSPTLRRFLEQHGHIFRTKSDVEVILHCYEEYPDDFYKFLNGMFAFAIWDGHRRTLIVGRDRVGIKPLYYAIRDNCLLFASELKALLVHPLVRREIDVISLHQYLAFEYVPSPRSIIKNVQKLSPGHILRASPRGVEITNSWKLSFEQSESRPPIAWREYREHFLTQLESTVQLELLSDVPVGAFLSGGLDSSAVTLMAQRKLGAGLKTFTLKFEDPSYDESSYAHEVASVLKTDHHELAVTDQMCVDEFDRLANVMDEPLADSSIIPTSILSRFAREHVKVVLGGDGGDEIFAGYPTLQAHRLIQWYERLVPRGMRAHAMPYLVSHLPVSFSNISLDFKIRRFLSGRGVPLGVRHQRWLGAFNDEQRMRLCTEGYTPGSVDTYEPVHAHLRECDAHEAINRILYLDFKMYLEGNILPKVDRASMAHALEVRVPLLNHQLIELVTDFPLYFKIRGLTSKYLLRRCMEGALPQKILRRRKKGFNIPVAHLLESSLKERLLDLLSEDRLRRQGLFNPGVVSGLVQDHLAHRADHRKLLWTLLTLQKWLDA